MKFKPFLIALLYTFCLIPLHAAWLNNMSHTIQQPDGTKISCLVSGDEFYHRVHDAKDYTIIQNSKTGYYTYAILENNEPAASDYIVGQTDPSSLGLTPGVRESEGKYRQSRQLWQDMLARSDYRAPTSGVLNNLVIFIRFSGEAEFGESISGYNSMFNNPQIGANSMRNYFEEVSYGALEINTSFYPEHPNGTVVSYQDSHPRSYYEPYSSSSNPGGYVDDNDRTFREHTLLRDAVDFCSAQIPATLNLDGDNDGQVDNICFTVKGGAGDWADLLWPHMWALESYNVMINGKRVFIFNFQLQEFLQSSGVGVLCHEMFHSLGSPDLYHYYSNGSPVGNWDLMEGTENPPQYMGAYMKFRYGHWIDSIPEITTTGTYTLHPLTSSTNNCYKIASPNTANQFYVVEYRKNVGTFEGSLPGTGLLIYRIDRTLDGIGNADGPPDEVYLYRPGGTSSSNGQVNQANYSSLLGRTAINDGTNPSAFLQDGSPGGLNISQISAPDTTMSFFVDFSLPPTTYTEGFESGNLTAFPWTLTGNTNWNVVSVNSFAGLYCAKSGAIGNNQSTSASLSYEVPQAGNVGFYRKVSSQSGHDYLVFYIDNVEKGRWAGTLDWAYTTFPVTAGNHVFKWTYLKNATTVSGSDCAWIDNISFPEEAEPPLLAPIDLIAQHENGNYAVLRWTAPALDILGYMIYRNNEFLDMVGATDSTVYHDPTALTGSTSYKVTSLYETGESPFSNEVIILPVGNDDQTDVLPTVSGLISVYPNPFNPETNISYQVNKQGAVSIEIFNIRGEKTKSLYQGNRATGKYAATWQGKDDLGRSVSSGIYFVRFTSNGQHDTRKIILLK